MDKSAGDRTIGDLYIFVVLPPGALPCLHSIKEKSPSASCKGGGAGDNHFEICQAFCFS